MLSGDTFSHAESSTIIGVAGLIGVVFGGVPIVYVGYCGHDIEKLPANVSHSRLRRPAASLAPPAHAGPAKSTHTAAAVAAKPEIFEDITLSRITHFPFQRLIGRPLPNVDRSPTFGSIYVELQHIVMVNNNSAKFV
jgi:hypothetical protein